MKARTVLSRQWRQYWIWHPLQAAPLVGLVGAIGLLPIDWVSGIGARLGRTFGPRIKRPTERALANLALVYPEKSEDERRRIMVGMWENLGRIALEYSVLLRIAESRHRIELEGVQNIVNAVTSGRPIIFISAHIGHWEISPVVAKGNDLPITGVYRPPNNRFVDRLVRRLRDRCGMKLLPRGRDSVREAMSLLGRGENLAMLIDQRMVRGRVLPFFGQPSLTGTTAAEMAIRFDAILLPVRVKRLRGARFRVITDPPIVPPTQGGREERANETMILVNQTVERWVRDTPEQWLWPHRRWELSARAR